MTIFYPNESIMLHNIPFLSMYMNASIVVKCITHFFLSLTALMLGMSAETLPLLLLTKAPPSSSAAPALSSTLTVRQRSRNFRSSGLSSSV